MTLLAAGIPSLLYAQSFTIDSSKKAMDVSGAFNNAQIHLPAVEKQPAYPGGKKAWQDFLRSNINIAVPFSNKAVPGTYNVIIQFIVGSDGKLSIVGADSNAGYGMESEVIRCMKKSADWNPAETSSGKKVNFALRTIVTFTVKQSDVVLGFS